jgi:putative ABC transport system ATP-binding protein
MNHVTATAIELHEVSKTYGAQPVLLNASAAVEKGGLVAVVGRSGSGKSTLLRLLGGLEAPDSGLVRIGGVDFSTLGETELALRRRSDLGFVFQSFNLIPTLTVAENVELPLALNGVVPGAASRRSRDLLAELGLGSCIDRFPEDVSGGEQQRAAIARAVVHEPKLVLADEPTGNLDVETAHQVLEVLMRTCRERAATLVVATHSAEIARRAERVLTIRGGHIEDVEP